MIFVALGSQKFPMDRLLVEIDRLIEKGMLKEEVFAQTGHCQYRPLYFNSIPFLNRDEFEHYVEMCNLLITHAGSGAIMSGLKRRKRVIAVPRLKIYGEHVDNHQKELAGILAEKGFLIKLEDMSMLADSIESARATQFNVYKSSTNNIVNIVNRFVQSF